MPRDKPVGQAHFAVTTRRNRSSIDGTFHAVCQTRTGVTGLSVVGAVKSGRGSGTKCHQAGTNGGSHTDSRRAIHRAAGGRTAIS